MKKLFAVLAIAAFMTACGDSTTTSTTNEDSLREARNADSIKKAMENMVDSSKDAINKTADSALDKMDNLKDSLKK